MHNEDIKRREKCRNVSTSPYWLSVEY